jgi:hypothetical protein
MVADGSHNHCLAPSVLEGRTTVVLTNQVKMVEAGMWPTPTASTNGPGKDLNNPRGIHQGNALATAVKMWPTPRARDHKDGTSVPPRLIKNPNLATLGQKIAMENSTRMWPTPTVRDYKDSGDNLNLYRHERQSGQLGIVVKRGDPTGGQLNPTFVEWLMGWPLGWTDLKPLAMDKFREWLQQHGKC